MQFFFLESRDTGLSANVYLKEMVIKLTVLLGCKGRNEKTHFKVLLVTNVPLSVENSHDIFNLYSLPSRYIGPIGLRRDGQVDKAWPPIGRRI